MGLTVHNVVHGTGVDIAETWRKSKIDRRRRKTFTNAMVQSKFPAGDSS